MPHTSSIQPAKAPILRAFAAPSQARDSSAQSLRGNTRIPDRDPPADEPGKFSKNRVLQSYIAAMNDTSTKSPPEELEVPASGRSDDADAILITLLDWYQEMGVDAALGQDPIDWLSRGETAPGHSVREAIRERARAPDARAPDRSGTPPARKPPDIASAGRQTHTGSVSPQPSPDGTQGEAGRPQRRFTPGPPDKTVADAQALAAKVSSLAELRDALEGFDGCGLKATAKNTCVFRGAETARLMIIGEAPGRDEDLEGRPFVGRAGQLLDKMLHAIGIDETTAHITNAVYWRPPGNRTPTPMEAQICRPFLERQIALVAPEIVLLLGASAARNILDTTDGIMRVRGRWQDLTLAAHSAKVMASLHPAYLLRTPAAKRLSWRDLLAVRQRLDDTR